MVSSDKENFASRVVGAEEGLHAKDLQIWGNTWRTELCLCSEELARAKLSSPLLFALQ